MSRNNRTRTARRRRIALSFGTAVGAALIAASISMGNAPVAGADVFGADTVSDLIGAADAQALAAAGVSNTIGTQLPDRGIRPELVYRRGCTALTCLALLGYYTDTYLLGPTGLDAELAPLVQELVGTISSGTPAIVHDRRSAT